MSFCGYEIPGDLPKAFVSTRACAIASMQVERERRRQAAKAAAEQKAKQAQSWIGWLTGMGGGQTATPASDDSDLRADLNAEEYAKLQELVDERDEAIQAGAVQPQGLHHRRGQQWRQHNLNSLAHGSAQHLETPFEATACKLHEVHCQQCLQHQLC